MRTLLFIIGTLLVSSTAMAQVDFTHPTVRLDTAVASPTSAPQDNLFGPGGMGGLKVAFNLTSWLDVDPSIETIQLSEHTSSGPGSSVAGAWAFGLGARIKRPHNAQSSSVWGIESPWVDADYQYYNTNGLNRMGVGVGVGISAPIDDDRHWWLGPVLRYNQIADGTSVGGTPGRDTRDARIISFGIELEFDSAGYKHLEDVVPPPPVQTLVIDDPPPVKYARDGLRNPPPPPNNDTIEITLIADNMIQFSFDSAVITEDSKPFLADTADLIKRHTSPDRKKTDPLYKAIQVNGYTSSENHSWAEKHNQKLSEQRAQAVVDFLASNGVPSDMLSAKGFGTSHPVASNKTEKGRKENRRVEFEITVVLISTGPISQFTTDGIK